MEYAFLMDSNGFFKVLRSKSIGLGIVNINPYELWIFMDFLWIHYGIDADLGF